MSVHDSSEKGRLLRRAHVVARVHHPNLARMLPLPGGAGLSPVSLGAPRLAEFSAPGAAFRGLELSRLVWVLLDVLSGEQGATRLVPLTNAHLMPNPPSEPGGYIAPELLLGEPSDRRADLFSVGVLLWEALAEYRLFPDGSRDAVLNRLDGDEVPALASLVQSSWALPLCRVAERAIAVAPSARFANALEFSSAIVAAAGRQLTSPPSERRCSRRGASGAFRVRLLGWQQPWWPAPGGCRSQPRGRR